MASRPETPQERAHHWNSVHLDGDESGHTWFQLRPSIALELLEFLGVKASSAFLDVGGGESNLVDHLLMMNFSDVTVLDISPEAIENSQRRVGVNHRVTWITEDLLSWRSSRRFDVWHDRAVFHFLTGDEVNDYRSMILRTLTDDGLVILATFAPTGPEYCSGLPVHRYATSELASFLGSDFEIVANRSEVHVTPSGVEQPFSWIAAQRRKSASTE